MSFLNIEDLLYRIPALLIGFTLHEFAHAYVAFRLGDPTAKNLGRLTLNPLKHLDPAGTIFLLLFRFGWAKPVPVNPFHFKGDREKGMMLVSLAGPGTNLAIAVVTALIWKYIEPQDIIVIKMLLEIFFINLVLAIFNFLPIPPLDGSKIFIGFLPRKFHHVIYGIEKYGIVILLLLSLTGVIGGILMPAVRMLAVAIASLLGVETLLRIFS